MNIRASSPQTWILTDGKIGDRVQCLGIAKALNASYCERTVFPKRPWSWFMPYGPIPFYHQPHYKESPIAGSLPSLIIASGRRTVSYIRALKKATPHHIKTVFLKDPRTAHDLFDAIWCPWHDQVNQPNQFSTLTSPHGITQQDLDHHRQLQPTFLRNLPAPHVGIILGDLWVGVPFHKKQAVLKDFISHLHTLKNQAGSFILTPSRRTPKAVYQAIQSALWDIPYWAWSGTGDNPYVSILANADALIVTGDSHNMVSEALSTTCPIMIYKTPFLKNKMKIFLSKIEQKNWVTVFHGSMNPQIRQPISATDEIAEFIRSQIPSIA